MRHSLEGRNPDMALSKIWIPDQVRNDKRWCKKLPDCSNNSYLFDGTNYDTALEAGIQQTENRFWVPPVRTLPGQAYRAGLTMGFLASF